MVESLLQALVAMVFLALIGFELAAAVVSWAEANGATPGRHRQLVWVPRPVTVRNHLAVRRRVVERARWQYPVLRTGRYAQTLRTAIRGLPRRSTDRLPRRPHANRGVQRPI
jgi:hypothetical protein